METDKRALGYPKIYGLPDGKNMKFGLGCSGLAP